MTIDNLDRLHTLLRHLHSGLDDSDTEFADLARLQSLKRLATTEMTIWPGEEHDLLCRRSAI
jgi:hypothetical protein